VGPPDELAAELWRIAPIGFCLRAGVRRNFGTTCFDRAASGPAAYAAILGTALAGGFHTPLNVAAPDNETPKDCPST
jgi:hypothetical protein